MATSTPGYTPLPSNGLATAPITFGAPTPVPTKAPTGQTSTAQPPASSTPTPIVSSTTAADHITGTVIPTMNAATTAIQNNNAAKAAAAANPPAPTNPAPTQTPPAPPTPEETIANTPDTGNQWAYDQQGNRVQVPISQPVPAGFSTTNPTIGPSTPVTNTVTTSAGTTYKQFSDGSYGTYDANGRYIGPAQQQDFQNAQGASDVMSKLTQLQNGTYPLTPAQQAQIDGLKAQFQQLITEQETANANFTGGTTIAMNRGGMGIQIAGQGEIQGTINSGLAKIADLNSKMASAVAQMQSSFQDDDLKMLTSAYDMYSGAVKERQSEIDNMQKAATDAAKDMRDYTEKVKVDQQTETHQNLQDQLASLTLSDKQKQEAISNAFQQQQITETQRHNLQTELVARQDALKGRYQYDSNTGSVFDTQTGKTLDADPANIINGAVTPGNTGNPLLDSNTQKTSNGVPYIDGTNFVGKQASDAQLAAAKLGIPYVGKTGAAALDNIASAKNDLGLIAQTVKNLSPNDTANTLTLGLDRFANWAVHGAEDITQVGPGATDISSYNAYKESAIKAIQGLASGGTGLRINQAEITTMIDSLPSYNDTQSVAAAKLAKIGSMLDNNEKNIIGEAAFDKYNPTAAATDLATFYQASPDHAAQVDQIRQAQPDLTPSQVMQLVQP